MSSSLLPSFLLHYPEYFALLLASKFGPKWVVQSTKLSSVAGSYGYGKANVVSTHIKTVTEHGILLESDQNLDTDIVILTYFSKK